MGGERGGPMIENLTDAEKTTLNSMSDTEKQAFFDKKRVEQETKMETREAVIDKILAGTALTTDEQTLRQEIITERATMKAKRTEMKAQMEKVKTILAKKKAGTTLTTDEQTLLDSMPKMDGKRDGKKWMRMMGGMGQ